VLALIVFSIPRFTVQVVADAHGQTMDNFGWEINTKKWLNTTPFRIVVTIIRLCAVVFSGSTAGVPQLKLGIIVMGPKPLHNTARNGVVPVRIDSSANLEDVVKRTISNHDWKLYSWQFCLTLWSRLRSADAEESARKN
jgi:hypothetical protein